MIIKAAVLREQNKHLVIEELYVPALAPGQVLIKVLYSGICRSQINEIKGNKGEDKYLPHTLGHEASAIVEDVGSRVTKVKKGDYVVLSWIKGEGLNENNCKYIKVGDNSVVNAGAATSFSEYSVVSENRLVKIPPEIPPTIGALLGCAVPTGVGIIKNELTAQRGKSLAIFGVGGIGFAALLGAVMAGLSPIIAIDINDDKLAYAQSNGATHIINSAREDVVQRVKEITSNSKVDDAINGGVDYAIDCVGIPSVSEMAFEVINNSGTALIAGNAKKGEKISIRPFDLILGKKIMGTWGGATQPDVDIPWYAQHYLSGTLPLDKLISKIYSLEEINQAIADLEEGRSIRALIRFKEK